MNDVKLQDKLIDLLICQEIYLAFGEYVFYCYVHALSQLSCVQSVSKKEGGVCDIV